MTCSLLPSHDVLVVVSTSSRVTRALTSLALAANDDAMPSILSCSSTSGESAPPRTEEVVPLPPTPFVVASPLPFLPLLPPFPSSPPPGMLPQECIYILETLPEAPRANHSCWSSRARLPPQRGRGTQKVVRRCCRRWRRCVISQVTVAMLIHPMSSCLRLVTFDRSSPCILSTFSIASRR